MPTHVTMPLDRLLRLSILEDTKEFMPDLMTRDDWTEYRVLKRELQGCRFIMRYHESQKRFDFKKYRRCHEIPQ